MNNDFLHDRPWISPWIISISNELDITIHVITSQLSGHCDVISDRLWHQQQNKTERMRHGADVLRSSFLSSFMDPSCRVWNKIMYVLSWRTVSALTRVLFWCLFPSLLRNSGNKHQNDPLVSAETVRHSSTQIILYICKWYLTFPSSIFLLRMKIMSNLPTPDKLLCQSSEFSAHLTAGFLLLFSQQILAGKGSNLVTAWPTWTASVMILMDLKRQDRWWPLSIRETGLDCIKSAMILNGSRTTKLSFTKKFNLGLGTRAWEFSVLTNTN